MGHCKDTKELVQILKMMIFAFALPYVLLYFAFDFFLAAGINVNLAIVLALFLGPVSAYVSKSYVKRTQYWRYVCFTPVTTLVIRQD